MILSDKDLATLTNRLQTPLIIGDIINGEGSLTADVRMGLHEILSNDQPDSALLSIALGAQKIANSYADISTSMKILNMECDRIIAEYGQLWLKNANAKTLDDTLVFETLAHIPEDLDALNELLAITGITLKKTAPAAAELCDIMRIQTKAHALIAETFLEGMEAEMDAHEADPWDTPANINIALTDQTQNAKTDNIIAFPISQAN